MALNCLFRGHGSKMVKEQNIWRNNFNGQRRIRSPNRTNMLVLSLSLSLSLSFYLLACLFHIFLAFLPLKLGNNKRQHNNNNQIPTKRGREKRERRD